MANPVTFSADEFYLYSAMQHFNSFFLHRSNFIFQAPNRRLTHMSPAQHIALQKSLTQDPAQQFAYPIFSLAIPPT
jgi:hypothetical protein